MALSTPAHVPNDPEPQQGRASELATDAVKLFADIAECLGSIRSSMVGMGQDLDAYASFSGVGTQSTGHIQTLSDVSQRALQLLKDANAPEALDASDEALAQAHRFLHAIIRASQTLSAVATLSRATAGSYGISTLNAYLNELATISNSIREDAKTVNVSLQSLADSRTTLQAFYKDASQALDGMYVVVQDTLNMSRDMAALEEQAAHSIQKEAAYINTESRTQIKGLMSAVQFADRLAQRVDHLGTILAHDNCHVRRLAVAQMRSIAAAMREEGHTSDRGADQLAVLARKGSDLFVAGDVASTMQRSTSTRAQAAERVAHDIGSVAEALSSTKTSLAAADAANRDALQRFDDLGRSAKQVATASINSVLFAARANDAKGALTMLSTEVRLVATQCLAAVGGCQAQMNMLQKLVGDDKSDLLSTMDDLSGAVSAFQADVDAASARLTELNALGQSALHRTECLLAEVGQLKDAMAAVFALAEALEEQANALNVSDSGALPDPEVLSGIWDLYTMDEERAVHAEVFAEFGTDLPADDTSATDDIDDLLF